MICGFVDSRTGSLYIVILLPTFHIVYSNFAVVKFVCNVLFSHLWLYGDLVWIEEEITLIKAVARQMYYVWICELCEYPGQRVRRSFQQFCV